MINKRRWCKIMRRRMRGSRCRGGGGGRGGEKWGGSRGVGVKHRLKLKASISTHDELSKSTQRVPSGQRRLQPRIKRMSLIAVVRWWRHRRDAAIPKAETHVKAPAIGRKHNNPKQILLNVLIERDPSRGVAWPWDGRALKGRTETPGQPSEDEVGECNAKSNCTPAKDQRSRS